MLLDIFSVISLILTVPLLVYCLVVLVIWGSEGFLIFFKKPNTRSSIEWLLLGVITGFTACFADNLYWAIAWSFEFVGIEPNKLFIYGALPNIFFRQLLGIYAAYCHIKSFCVHKGIKGLKKQWIFCISALIGVIIVCILATIR